LVLVRPSASLALPTPSRETFRAARWDRETFLHGNHRAITVVPDEKESPQPAARPRCTIIFTRACLPAIAHAAAPSRLHRHLALPLLKHRRTPVARSRARRRASSPSDAATPKDPPAPLQRWPRHALAPAPAPRPALAQIPPNTHCEESRLSPCLVSAGRRHAEGSACSSSTTAAARRSPHQRLQEPVDLPTPVSRDF